MSLPRVQVSLANDPRDAEGEGGRVSTGWDRELANRHFRMKRRDRVHVIEELSQRDLTQAGGPPSGTGSCPCLCSDRGAQGGQASRPW